MAPVDPVKWEIRGHIQQIWLLQVGIWTISVSDWSLVFSWQQAWHLNRKVHRCSYWPLCWIVRMVFCFKCLKTIILPPHTVKLRVYWPKLASWIVLPRSCVSEDCNLNNYSAWVYERGIISWFLFQYEWWLVIPPSLLALSLITCYLMVCISMLPYVCVASCLDGHLVCRRDEGLLM